MVSTLTSCDVDHVLKWTRLSVRISAVGSKVMRIYCARRTDEASEPLDRTGLALTESRACAVAGGVSIG